MRNVSVSQPVNQVDNSHFTLYAEWESTYFKVILLRSCKVPLKGEMHIENANYYLDELEESFETYLEKTEQAFSGKDADIQFFLQDDTFTWKQQNTLTRGEITVQPLSNMLIMSDTLKQLLERYEKCQQVIAVLTKKNEYLNKTNDKLITDIEEMINMKDKMERDLYEKFLLLLNTKKKKIKELQEIIDKNDKRMIKTKSVYDKTTDDESEGSNKSEKMYSAKSLNVRKRKMKCTSEQKIMSKRNPKRDTSSSSSDSTSPKPSTSKDKQTLCDTSVQHVHLQSKLPNTPEEESEEDLFSQ